MNLMFSPVTYNLCTTETYERTLLHPGTHVGISHPCNQCESVSNASIALVHKTQLGRRLFGNPRGCETSRSLTCVMRSTLDLAVANRSSHRRSISEPSTPDTPAPPGIRHDDVGSGELPHFEEWSTFVKGCVGPHAAKLRECFNVSVP